MERKEMAIFFFQLSMKFTYTKETNKKENTYVDKCTQHKNFCFFVVIWKNYSNVTDTIPQG